MGCDLYTQLFQGNPGIPWLKLHCSYHVQSTLDGQWIGKEILRKTLRRSLPLAHVWGLVHWPKYGILILPYYGSIRHFRVEMGVSKNIYPKLNYMAMVGKMIFWHLDLGVPYFQACRCGCCGADPMQKMVRGWLKGIFRQSQTRMTFPYISPVGPLLT
jgi:hypothetical protein